MSELAGAYALWYREIKVFLREKSRIASSLVNPLIWLIAFGSGLGSLVSSSVPDYPTYIFPGILMLTVLFTSIFFGLYLIWDKRVDFFKEVLAAPLRRTTLFVGKMLGGCTDSLLQAGILLIFGIFFGVKYTPYAVFVLVMYIIFISVGTTSLGLAIGAQMNSFEGFGLVQSFVIYPLYFFSGAIYPIIGNTSLPPILADLAYINPLTYMVDGMRSSIYPVSSSAQLRGFPPLLDFAVGVGFMLFMVGVGVYSFEHLKY